MHSPAEEPLPSAEDSSVLPQSGAGPRTLLLSIRPHYAEMILSGSKRVELRKTRPLEAEAGSKALIYASSPAQAIVARFSVEKVVEKRPQELWPEVSEIAGVTKNEFDAYYGEANRAIGIFIHHLACLAAPFPLERLRTEMSGFTPPQSFRYMSQQQTRHIVGGAS